VNFSFQASLKKGSTSLPSFWIQFIRTSTWLGDLDSYKPEIRQYRCQIFTSYRMDISHEGKGIESGIFSVLLRITTHLIEIDHEIERLCYIDRNQLGLLFPVRPLPTDDVSPHSTRFSISQPTESSKETPRLSA